jgi:hypothetical protein
LSLKQFSEALGVALGLSLGVPVEALPADLEIYFIDVEGGQSTLIVTPVLSEFSIGAPGNGRATRPDRTDRARTRDLPRAGQALCQTHPPTGG